MRLNQIADKPGSRTTRKTVGRGIGSGLGKTSGRGQKGQKARNTVAPGFEGGQMPLYRRIPIRGFNNKNFKTNYMTINIGSLQKLVDDKRLKDGATVDLKTLQDMGVMKSTKDGLKILGNGELKAKLNITAVAATQSAADKVSKAGGKITLKPLKEGVTKFLPKSAKNKKSA